LTATGSWVDKSKLLSKSQTRIEAGHQSGKMIAVGVGHHMKGGDDTILQVKEVITVISVKTRGKATLQGSQVRMINDDAGL
jgi:co-chaperonin GroES (HSP10)